MSSSEFLDLCHEGSNFLINLRETPVEGELHSHLQEYPYSVVGQYARTRQFYVASDIEVAAIEVGGTLPPGFKGFSPEDEAFFVNQFDEQQLRSFDATDADKVRSFVLSRTPDGEPKPTTLIPESLLDSADTRTVPEPLMFFLRNLHHLSRLGEVEAPIRDRAEHIVQKYLNRLVVDDQIASTVYAVDPKSPALIRTLLGDPNLPWAGSANAREQVRLRQTDQLYVADTLLTEHLTVAGTASYPAEPIVTRMLEGDSMVVFKPANT
jgi:hypothetical protein